MSPAVYLGHPNDIEPNTACPFDGEDEWPQSAEEAGQERSDELETLIERCNQSDMLDLASAFDEFVGYTTGGDSQTYAALMLAVSAAKNGDETKACGHLTDWFDLVKRNERKRASVNRQIEIDREEREEVAA